MGTSEYVLDEPVLDRLWPGEPLTLKDWEAVPDYELHRFECVEGVLTVKPRGTLPHQAALSELTLALRSVHHEDPVALLSTYVVLEHEPLTVRRPDVVLLDREVFRRGDDYWPTADDVRLVVEVLGEGTRRIDRVLKLSEYADAGIPEYWILDVEGEPTLSVHRLAERGRYEHIDDLTGKVSVAAAGHQVTLDLPEIAS